ncbi:SGNH/GDSL hydrolase family protein [Roseomonas sp. M0104]|uniref:SGNH/GDSL hydrolase family protein n=1 Tax=Teichococcus coralli TaxID=2545983 RepID=A0A845B384_9PROT|nr:GDSL-type esterase/lipase family protein [Pseudoroseomonas coralli]MXP62113.1 SGNH/GDSL hydrolase family protein [Pseudoroseomonas coralli]
MRLVRLFTIAASALALAFPPTTARAGDACPVVQREELVLPATRAALRAGRPVTILALGSSSTEGVGASSAQGTYPARLQAKLRHALTGHALSVANRGKGGEDAAQMVARLGRELEATHPTLVIWQAGANSAARRENPARFAALMQEGIARIQAAGADLVLMDNQRSPVILASTGHEAFDAALARLADANHASLFSRGALMRRWEQAGLPATAVLSADGMHHNDLGYECLSAALAEAILAATSRGAALAAMH